MKELRHFRARRRRGSVALEFTLALPAALLLFGAVAQFFSFSQNRIYVQYAAYAAARSALAHMCPPVDLRDALRAPLAGLAQAACTDDPRRWLDAARWAVVGAAPSSDAAARRGACDPPAAAPAMMTATSMPDGLAPALRNRLCYAFEPGNVEVTVAWDRGMLGALAGARPAVRATVRFRYPVAAPIGMFLADGRRADGTRWRWGEATAVLL